ncbi:hypothetical protein WLV55_23910, partial [Bordetella bronchiseptica]
GASSARSVSGKVVLIMQTIGRCPAGPAGGRPSPPSMVYMIWASLASSTTTPAAGAPADLCLVDLDADWTAAPAAMRSRSVHTPFAGMMLPGRVRATLVAGRTVWETPA